MESAIVEEKKGLSVFWLLPLVALCIGGWLVYKSVQDAGYNITVHFTDVSGITPGKTLVMLKGLPIGEVKSWEVDTAMRRVNVSIEMDKLTRGHLGEDTKFWVVRPEITPNGIRGLDTLISGSYITLAPGTSDTLADTFTALTEPPPLSPDAPGLHISVTAKSLYSIQEGSGIYYRRIQVGTVQDYRLQEDDTVKIDLFIRPQFSHMLSSESRFWNAGGFTLAGDFRSFKLQMPSLLSLFKGGIVFDTPIGKDQAKTVENGDSFVLHEDFEDAEYGIPVKLRLRTGEGLLEGVTKLMYRGMKAGVVSRIVFNKDKNHSVTAHILIDPRARGILRDGTKFWVVKPEVSMSRMENLDTLLTGSHITFEIGDGGFKNEFVALEIPPPAPVLRPGKRFRLVSSEAGSLQIGSPVSYRKFQIGEISGVKLREDNTGVDVEMFIYSEYMRLVRQQAVFVNTSGVHIRGGLTGLDINISSFRSLMQGGVTLLLPKTDSRYDTGISPEDHVFTLYSSEDEANDAIKARYNPDLSVVLESAVRGSLEEGSPVYYRQVEVGKVDGFTLAADYETVFIHLTINGEYRDLIRVSTRFWNVSGLKVSGGILSGIEVSSESLSSLLKGGITLATPLHEENGRSVVDGHHFSLHEKPQDAWLDWVSERRRKSPEERQDTGE